MNLIARLSLLLPAVLMLTLSASAQAGGDGSVPLPLIPKAKPGTHCVAPLEVMRTRHMDFLKHHRYETMHEGIRTKQYSLKQCIDCHVSPQQSLRGSSPQGHFCKNCHEYAGVMPDCFECHSSQPEKPAGNPAVTGSAGEDARVVASAGLARQLTAKGMNETGASQ